MEFRHWPRARISNFLIDNAELIRTYPVAVISCLDGDFEVAGLVPFRNKPELRWRQYVCVDGKTLLEYATSKRLFFGYDEVWLGNSSPRNDIPYPALIGPCDRVDYLPEGFWEWFEGSGFDVGVGDGHEGLNLVCNVRILECLVVPDAP